MKTHDSSFARVNAAVRRAMILVFVFSFAVNLLILTLPIYMLSVFDRVISSRSYETLLYLTLMACFAMVMMGAFEWLRGRLLVRLGTWWDHHLSPTVFGAIIAASNMDQRGSTRLLNDIQDVRGFLAGGAVVQLLDAPWLPVFLLVLWFLNPLIGLIGLIGAVLLILLAVINEFATRPHTLRALDNNLRAQNEAAASLRNNETINALGMGNNVVARWMASYVGGLEHGQKGNDVARTMLASAKTIRLIVQIAILGAGAYLVLEREFTPGAMIAGSILLGRALAPIENAIDTWKQLVAARAAYDRLNLFFSEYHEPSSRTKLEMPPPRGNLSASGVVYAYPGTNHAIIRGTTFEILAGEVIAIIGPSGAGKSTLARLLMGVVAPIGGSVRLDGIEIKNWDREQLGPYDGYLPQDVELFAGTIAENIGRFSQLDSEAVMAAAKRAGVHELVSELPQHYDTQLGERGMTLSGGQRQRLGLARALYGNPVLVILDEPNANLDSEGEEHLLRVIASLKQEGCTVVFIAHRPSMLSSADRIILLRDGRIEAFGPRDEVLKRVTQPRSVPDRSPTPSLIEPAQAQA